MPLILPSNSISAVGYDVANSLRFDDGSSDNLTRTFGSGDRRTFTISCWLKRSNLGADGIFNTYTNGSNYWVLEFNSSDQLVIKNITGGATNVNLITNAVFRDISAWYNFVVDTNTLDATESNRVKLYINGEQVTSFGTSTYPAQNTDLELNQAQSHMIGAGVGSGYFDGYIAEFVFVDGTSLDPTSFGEFDADTGIWKPINVSGLTFGTNGFYLDFENSGSLGADVSGNGNNFTVNNLTSIDQTTDTPTLNYATLNPLNGVHYSGLTFSEGNLKITTTAAAYTPAQSTIGFNTGKWYAEFKATDVDNWTMVGIVGQNATATNGWVGRYADGYAYIGGSSAGGVNSKMNNNISSTYASTYVDGDIISVAVDCDNNYIYFGLNGTWLNSGDPESGASGTGSAFSISTTPASGFYYFAVCNYSGSQTPDWEANFGNPPFTISSGNSDGNGKGNFEYAVPSGYFALCTSNLAEHG